MCLLPFFSDDIDDGKSIGEPEGIDDSQSTTNLRYGTGGRRHYRPRHRHRNHWANEDTFERLNGKGIIGHNDGIDEEIQDVAFHPAGAKIQRRLLLYFVGDNNLFYSNPTAFLSSVQ